ncbi:MAG: ATP-binding protein [Syntrophorhabdaceae bacterium]|nr:ATP-binding protein [Syntrophorhabdaceae bacterium]
MGYTDMINRVPTTYSLTFKLTIWVGITLILFIGIYAYTNIAAQRETLLNEAILWAKQLSGTLTRSLRFNMLHNYREAVHHAIETVGAQEEIEKVRIFNKDGQIMFSSDKKEIGTMVGKTTEACYACHLEGKPLVRLDTPSRARIFKSGGKRILGMITPIYNGPDCYTAKCHAHSPEQNVLGVFDVTLSLENTDKIIAQVTRKTILFAIITIMVVSIVIILVIHRYVNWPVKELVKATTQVAEGDFNYEAKIFTKDEMGMLSESFARMTQRLKKADEELKEFIKTLEDKVEERTSALKEAQAQLIQSEKLASIGKLSATIAHEINNPLNGILTYTKLIERKLASKNLSDEEITKISSYLSVMERETQRCSTIVRNLLDFSRQREPSLKNDVNINLLIEDAVTLLSNHINLQEIKLEKVFSQVPTITADPMQLRQVFLNIILNSCEALEGGGKITIYTDFIEKEEMVLIKIVDNGPGIDPDILPKIFDPFFTTKESGTGLGLSVVYGIVSSHRGTLNIESVPAHGTTVTIKLPRTFNVEKGGM